MFHHCFRCLNIDLNTSIIKTYFSCKNLYALNITNGIENTVRIVTQNRAEIHFCNLIYIYLSDSVKSVYFFVILWRTFFFRNKNSCSWNIRVQNYFFNDSCDSRNIEVVSGWCSFYLCSVINVFVYLCVNDYMNF